MHQASEKDFKIARRWQMHRGLPCVIGESGSTPQGVSSGGGVALSSSTSTSSSFSNYIIYTTMNAHVMLMKMQR
jgi:hypothetical protein